MKSNLISKRETAAFLQEITARWNMELPKIRNLKVHYMADGAQLVTGGGIKVLKIDQEFLPFLSDTALLERFPHVTVDMGAVKFMCKGANVMRPGINAYTEFEKNSIVCIIEESQKKVLAVGKALVSSSELDGMDKGAVLQNLHYISDRFWDVGKTVKD